jgi:hypothetical protein
VKARPASPSVKVRAGPGQVGATYCSLSSALPTRRDPKDNTLALAAIQGLAVGENDLRESPGRRAKLGLVQVNCDYVTDLQ